MKKMKKLSVAELGAASREANAVLAGARLSRFFETATRTGVFRLKFNSPQRGEVNVLVDLSFGAFLATQIPPSPEKPSAFAAAVRSRLTNAFLRGVSLVNNDRILRFDFEKKEKFALVFEFVGAGNALLLENNEILFVWKRTAYSARRLAPKEVYRPPPAGGNPPKESAPRASAEIEREYWLQKKGGEAIARGERKELCALEKALAAQREALHAFEKEEANAATAGEWIKTHSGECEELIAAAKSKDSGVLKKFKARRDGAFVEFEADG
ncbi:MAG: NFACT family protein [Candidatus Norongarragalinales archaeon]